jgi:hypothetical protein
LPFSSRHANRYAGMLEDTKYVPDICRPIVLPLVDCPDGIFCKLVDEITHVSLLINPRCSVISVRRMPNNTLFWNI